MITRLDETTLISIFVKGVLLGILTILYGVAMYILTSGKAMKFARIPHIIVATALFALAFAATAVELRRDTVGYIQHGDSLDGASLYFNTTNDPLFLLNAGIAISQVFIGDSFLIYRLYIVWSRNRHLVFPFIASLTGYTVCIICVIVEYARAYPATTFFSPQFRHWLVAGIVLTLSTNIGCTCLIAFKIGRMMRSVPTLRSPTVSRALAVIIESGALYSVTYTVALVTYLRGDRISITFLFNMTVQIIGITFSLIIVRIGLGISAERILTLSTLRAREVTGNDDLEVSKPTARLSLSTDVIGGAGDRALDV